MILTPLQKLPKNVGDLVKIIVAKGFEWLTKVQKIAKSGHTTACAPLLLPLKMFSSRPSKNVCPLIWMQLLVKCNALISVQMCCRCCCYGHLNVHKWWFFEDLLSLCIWNFSFIETFCKERKISNFFENVKILTKILVKLFLWKVPDENCILFVTFKLWNLKLLVQKKKLIQSIKKRCYFLAQVVTEATISTRTAKEDGHTTIQMLSSESWMYEWILVILLFNWLPLAVRATPLPHCPSCGRIRVMARFRYCHLFLITTPATATAQLLERVASSWMLMARTWAAFVRTAKFWIQRFSATTVWHFY